LIQNPADGFFGTGHLLTPEASLWHLVCQNGRLSSQVICKKAEKGSILTIWHLACQKPIYDNVVYGHVFQEEILP
jgi:hypothetical protein